jgi:hypothetical protein
MFIGKIFRGMMAGMILITFARCDGDEDRHEDTLTYTFEFNEGDHSWKPFFSDYPVGAEESYELDFQRTGLPDPLDNETTALKLTGNNHSDDLLSIIYRKFTDLEPNTRYKVTFDVDFASITPSNSVGVGGSPDLSFGAGGVAFEPANTTDDQGLYRPNFVSTLQSGTSNEVFKVLGKIGVKENNTAWTLINRNNKNSPITLKTNGAGELWLMMGTDSGFEATTTLYFRKIVITLTP